MAKKTVGNKLLSLLLIFAMFLSLLPTFIISARADYTLRENEVLVTDPFTLPESGTVIFVDLAGSATEEFPHKYTVDYAAYEGTLSAYEGPYGDIEIPANKGITVINCTGKGGDFGFFGGISIPVPNANTTLTSVIVPDGVKTLAANTFKSCVKLARVGLPSSLEIIGDNALAGRGTSGLGVLTTVYTTGKEIKDNIIDIPYGVTSINSGSFAYQSYTTVIIPDSVTSIGATAFGYNKNLTSVRLSESPLFTTLPTSMFYGCSGLKEIFLPDNITGFNDNSFQQTKITHLTLGKGFAFASGVTINSSTSNLISYIFLGQATELKNAFAGTTLKYVVFPDTITVVSAASGIAPGGNIVTAVLPGAGYPELSGATALFSGTLNPEAVIYCHKGSEVDKFCTAQGYNVQYLPSDVALTVNDGNSEIINNSAFTPRHFRAMYFDFEERNRPDEEIQNVTALDALVTAHESEYSWTGGNAGNELVFDANGNITTVFGKDATGWTFTVDDEIYSINAAASTIIPGDAESLIFSAPSNAPVFQTQPVDTEYYDTDTEPVSLTVSALAPDEITYQWYSNAANSNENGTVIQEAISTSCTPTIETVAADTITYYYCVATSAGETTASNPAKVTVKVDPTPTVSLTDSDDAQLNANYTYVIDSAGVVTLKADHTSRVTGGAYTYQWLSSSTSGGSFTGITGAINQTYTPAVNAAGTAVYKCQVTYTVGGLPFITTSEESPVITVTSSKVLTPVVSVNETNITRLVSSLTEKCIEASVEALTDGGTLTYQWYASTDNISFTGIDGATSASYALEPLSAEGVRYYYCVVTNSNQGETATANSSTIKVEYLSKSNLLKLWGNGTAGSPYLIANLDELMTLRDMVNSGDSFEGKYFTLTASITLPENWIPIGAYKPNWEESYTGFGSQLWPFSGTFDGGGNMVTIPEGELPLFNHVRLATIKNLNIYGEKIAGSALVNGYTIDYGPTGTYGRHPEYTVEIDNVTLKSGSSTLKSGFVAGDASGINIVRIKNSTIESGVVIGYTGVESGIGSFIGGLNGTIVNSTSGATVKGNSSVGGLIGYKGQSMGLCSITNSSFTGAVDATGNYVGGIIGKGYTASDAPNSPSVSIQDCYVASTVKGGNYVGGLMGGEGNLQTWDNGIGYVQNNHFYGTVTATSGNYVGGIIGYLGSLNKHNVIRNNYYLANEGLRGIGYVKYVDTSSASPREVDGVYYMDTSKDDLAAIKAVVDGDSNFTSISKTNHNRTDDPLGADADKLAMGMTSQQMSDGTVVSLLNAGTGSFKGWKKGTAHPVHDDEAEAVVYELSIGGTYKTVYYLDEAYSTAGMTITAHLTDGSTKALTASQVEFNGFNNKVTGAQIVTASYEGAQALLEISVIKDYGTGNSSNTITVRFALVGSSLTNGGADVDVNNGDYKGAKYEVWIPMTTYVMDKDATVLELFNRALNARGMDYSISYGDNYVDGIKRPGSEWLSEFSNGPRSGWMYTVGKNANGSDGSHPSLGLREYVLENNDVIIWHYVNDFAYEIPDWVGDAEHPALATNDDHYNKWLDALNGKVTGTPNNNNPGDAATTIIEQEVVVSGNTATAKITEKAVDDAIEAAKKAGGSITIIPTEVGNASEIKIELPTASAKKIADDTDSALIIETVGGIVDIPNETLSSIAKQATGANLEITVTQKSVDSVKGKLPDTQLSGAVIVEVSVASGGQNITEFGGESITISIPVGSVFTADKSYKVIVIGTDDKVETIIGKCVRRNGKLFVEFDITHLSTFVVTTTTELVEMTFTDVNSNAWYYDAVKYAFDNGLMNGTGATTFEPNTNLTRAMLVTVLYRYEGEPAVTASNPFSDVVAGQWYTDAVIWASENKIVEGYGDGVFGTTDNITREQVATILLRYAKFKNIDTSATADLSAYTDVNEIASWALDAMKWTGEGLITGRTATELAPKGETTRAEVATVLMRFIEEYLK